VHDAGAAATRLDPARHEQQPCPEEHRKDGDELLIGK
jgi:hypothetical protein